MMVKEVSDENMFCRGCWGCGSGDGGDDDDEYEDDFSTLRTLYQKTVLAKRCAESGSSHSPLVCKAHSTKCAVYNTSPIYL